MSRSVLIAIAVSFLLVTPVFASNIGPVRPQAATGNLYYGLGYTHTESKWEENGGAFSGLKMQQNKFYGQAGYALSNWSGYVRGGLSTLTVDRAFKNFDGSYEGENIFPFVTLGATGQFFASKNFSAGPFIQGSYYLGENEDTGRISNIQIDPVVGLETVEETVTVDGMWEAKAGLIFQGGLEGAQLYGGPMYYISRADIESSTVGSTAKMIISKTVEEQKDFGFVFGIQWQLLKDLTLELEAQLRSDYDLGFVLNKRF